MIADRKQRLSKLDKWDWILALMVGLGTLMIYNRTVVPGLLPGDSGEFQTLPYLLGSTHPTGYPVYLLLARLFTFIPLGELAHRANLFSALMGAVTVAGLYLCGRLLSGFRAIAFTTALAFAVSATFWSQALIAEVYTSGAAFIALILLALIWWDISENNWGLFAAGLLGGLSLGVHMSVALLAPAILLFLLLHWRQGWQMWKSAVLGALGGLVVAVLLFIIIDLHNPTASYFNSVIEPSRSAWELEANQIDGPFEHLLFGWQGRQFQYLMFADGMTAMKRQAMEYWANLGNELAMSLVLLAVVGAAYLLLRRLKIAVLLIAALIVQLLYFFNYEIWDLYVFYIPSYLLLALLSVAGLGALLELLQSITGRFVRQQYKLAVGLDIIVAILILIFAVWPLLEPRHEAFLDGDVPFEFDEYPVYEESLGLIAVATVDALPANAILFTDWDMMWPYYHVAQVQNDRSDLAFIETLPADDQNALADSLLAFVVENVTDRPIFFEDRHSQLEQVDTLSMSPIRVGPTRLFKVTQNQP